MHLRTGSVSAEGVRQGEVGRVTRRVTCTWWMQIYENVCRTAATSSSPFAEISRNDCMINLWYWCSFFFGSLFHSLGTPISTSFGECECLLMEEQGCRSHLPGQFLSKQILIMQSITYSKCDNGKLWIPVNTSLVGLALQAMSVQGILEPSLQQRRCSSLCCHKLALYIHLSLITDWWWTLQFLYSTGYHVMSDHVP